MQRFCWSLDLHGNLLELSLVHLVPLHFADKQFMAPQTRVLPGAFAAGDQQ